MAQDLVCDCFKYQKVGRLFILSFLPVTLCTCLLVGVWKPSIFTSVLKEWKSPMSASQRRGRCPRMATQRRWRRRWGRLKASCAHTGLPSAGPLSSRPSSARRPSSRSSSTSVSCSRRSPLPEVGGAVVITFFGVRVGGQSVIAALHKNQALGNGFHLPDSF